MSRENLPPLPFEDDGDRAAPARRPPRGMHNNGIVAQPPSDPAVIIQQRTQQEARKQLELAPSLDDIRSQSSSSKTGRSSAKSSNPTKGAKNRKKKSADSAIVVQQHVQQEARKKLELAPSPEVQANRKKRGAPIEFVRPSRAVGSTASPGAAACQPTDAMIARMRVERTKGLEEPVELASTMSPPLPRKDAATTSRSPPPAPTMELASPVSPLPAKRYESLGLTTQEQMRRETRKDEHVDMISPVNVKAADETQTLLEDRERLRQQKVGLELASPRPNSPSAFRNDPVTAADQNLAGPISPIPDSQQHPAQTLVQQVPHSTQPQPATQDSQEAVQVVQPTIPGAEQAVGAYTVEDLQPVEVEGVVLANITQIEEREEKKSNRLGLMVFCVAVVIAAAAGTGLGVGLRGSGLDNATNAPSAASAVPTVSAFPSFSPTLSPTRSPWVLGGPIMNGSAANDLYGSQVVLRGDTLAVSSPGFNNSTGLVRVTNMTTGVQIGQELFGASVGYGFGVKLAMSADGARLAVLSSGSNGAVHIYTFNMTWQEMVIINSTFIVDAGGLVNGLERIGDMALSANGIVLAIAANNIYSFEDIGGNWVPRSNGLDVGIGPAYVSVSGDGRYLMVGALDTNFWRVYQFLVNARLWLDLRGPTEDFSSGPQNQFVVRRATGGLMISDDATRIVVGDATGVVQVYAINVKLQLWERLNGTIPLVGSVQVDPVDMAVTLNGDAVGIVYYGADQSSPRAAVYTNDGQQWVPRGETVQVAPAVERGPVALSMANNGRSMAIGLPYSKLGSSTGVGRVEFYEI